MARRARALKELQRVVEQAALVTVAILPKVGSAAMVGSGLGVRNARVHAFLRQVSSADDRECCLPEVKRGGGRGIGTHV